MQNAIAFCRQRRRQSSPGATAHKVEGCMGFAVYRIDSDGNETPLPSMAVFPDSRRSTARRRERFPIQKFYWKDPYARLVADKTGTGGFATRSFRSPASRAA